MSASLALSASPDPSTDGDPLLARRTPAILLAVLCLAGPAQGGEIAQSQDCIIQPSRVVKLSSPVSGVLEVVRVDRGDVVRAGEIVAELESRVERAELALAERRIESFRFLIAAAEARRRMREGRLERQRRLLATRTTTEANFEEAEAEFEQAVQELARTRLEEELARTERDRAAARLEQRLIRSPVNGVVIERALNPGEYRNEQAHIVTIASTDPLHVEVFLPAAFYPRLAVGQRATVRPEEAVGGEYEGVVAVVDPVIDAASGTFGVRVRLPNPSDRLPAGLRCEAVLHAIDEAVGN